MRRLFPGTFRFYLTLAIVALVLWIPIQFPIDDSPCERLPSGIPTANANGVPSRDEIVADLLWCKTHGLFDQLPDNAPLAVGEMVAGSAGYEEMDPCSSTAQPAASPRAAATTRPISPPQP
jgi:hypothetical protein